MYEVAWNEAALHLLDLQADSAFGADLVVDTERWLRCQLPAAVGEWFRAGADRRLAQLSDNLIADLAALDKPDDVRLLDAGLLPLETDSQGCCRWVTPLDGDDNPIVYLIDPDDVTGESRTPYANGFTAYTEAKVWDAQLFQGDDLGWSFDYELSAGAIGTLDTMLRRRPTTFGWAHNQRCDAIYRFDGPARVAIAVRGTTAVWTITSTPYPVPRTKIADILGVPPGDRT